MPVIEFTDNYEDLSTDQGFQFKFRCERCGDGFMSTFQTNALGVAGSLLQPGMVGQAQVVVGAEVEHALTVHHHPGVRRGFDGADVDEEVGLGQGVEVGAEEVEFGRGAAKGWIGHVH